VFECSFSVTDIILPSEINQSHLVYKPTNLLHLYGSNLALLHQLAKPPHVLFKDTGDAHT